MRHHYVYNYKNSKFHFRENCTTTQNDWFYSIYLTIVTGTMSDLNQFPDMAVDKT